MFNRSKPDVPADSPERLLAQALQDAQELLAFGAQAGKPLGRERIDALIDASHAVNQRLMSGEQPDAQELKAFWAAHDNIASQVGERTAESIATSRKINRSGFPEGWLNASCSLAVLAAALLWFTVYMLSDWSHGTRLYEQIEKHEARKAELTAEFSRTTEALQRLEFKRESLAARECAARRYCEFALCPTGRCARGGTAEAAQARAALERFDDDLQEQRLKRDAVERDLAQAHEKSQPLQSELAAWEPVHGKALRRLGEAQLMQSALAASTPDAASAAALNAEKARLAELRWRAEVAFEQAGREAANAPNAARAQADRMLYDARRQLKLARAAEDDLQERIARDQAADFLVNAARVETTLKAMSSYWVPLLMGLLGTLAYILRDVTTRLRDHTYVPTAASVNVVRISLGAMAGVFGGLLLPSGDGPLTGVSPVIVPFILGYGIEIVFAALNRFVRAFTEEPKPA